METLRQQRIVANVWTVELIAQLYGDLRELLVTAVLPSAAYGDGLEGMGRGAQTFSAACSRSPSVSSILACSMNRLLICM